MSIGFPEKWEALLESLRAQYPELYRSWMAGLDPPRVEGGELRIVVDDPARTSYLRESCAAAFVQLAMQVTGLLMPVRFVCEREPHAIPTPGQPPALTKMPISPDYTFEQFVVGSSNRLANATCRAVCGQPGTLYNPLFIHGRSGLGKTHLLQATCHALMQGDAAREVIYISCDTFVNDLVRAIETARLQQFRDCARNADALVIDDVQFLANRESSQEELFHTFNVLYQARRQIILSADSPPGEIPTLEDRLVSRFNWGLVAQIDPPNRETRQAILQKKARLRGCEVPDEILDLIASRVESNIRLLEGALTKLISETQITGRPLTIETARQVLDEFDGRPARPPAVGDILETVSRHFGVRPSDLVGRKRSRSVSFPRQVGMYLARKLTPLSLEEIGSYFGGRDHSTVLHAERVIDTERRRTRETAETLSLLTRQLLSHR
jgi:chromosomal replication initiator protein